MGICLVTVTLARIGDMLYTDRDMFSVHKGSSQVFVLIRDTLDTQTNRHATIARYRIAYRFTLSIVQTIRHNRRNARRYLVSISVGSISDCYVNLNICSECPYR